MRPRLVIIYLLIVVIPLILLTGMGIHIALGERERLKRQFQELVAAKLRDVDSSLARFMETRQRELLDIIQRTASEPESLRKLPDTHPWISQAFLLAPGSKLLYPASGADLSDAEIDFLERTREIWIRGDLFSRSEWPGSPKESFPAGLTQLKSILLAPPP